MRKIYIRDSAPQQIAVVEDGRLIEYLVDQEDASMADTVILGRVERIVHGLDAAFVDIGQ